MAGLFNKCIYRSDIQIVYKLLCYCLQLFPGNFHKTGFCFDEVILFKCKRTLVVIIRRDFND